MRSELRPFWATRNGKVFVIGPIDEPDTATRARSDDILDLMIKPAVSECGFKKKTL